MHLLSMLLFSVSSNLDSLVVGLSYGIKKIPIYWHTNVLVGCISFTGTVLSMLFGKSLLLILPEGLANMAGGIIILLIGAVGLARMLSDKTSGPAAVNGLTIREGVLLGAALTVNNVGLGVGVSITGLPLLPTSLCSFFFSLAFLYAGNRIGRIQLPVYVDILVQPLAHLLMIALGLYEIIV